MQTEKLNTMIKTDVCSSDGKIPGVLREREGDDKSGYDSNAQIKNQQFKDMAVKIRNQSH